MEFARPLALDKVGPGGIEQSVTATPDECAAVAGRLLIPAVHRLSCRFRLRRLPGSVIEAECVLDASVDQVCVVSLETFEQPIAEAFSLQFVPSGTEAPDDDLESPDQIVYEGSAIDLGEAATQQLALALDPYPRRPGLEPVEEPGEAAPHPFAALAALRTKQ